MSYPILYAANETNFKHLGLSVLSDATKCLVTRERNGLYFLEMEYPIDGKDYKEIQLDRIIRCDAGYRAKKQCFVITKITDKMNGYAEIYCKHIAVERISKNALLPKVSVVGNGADALEMWRSSLVDGSSDFATWSDVTTYGEARWNIEDFESAYQVLGGHAGSILDIWGGEYEFDNLTVKLWDSMGRKTSNIIAYGRNLSDLEQEQEILNTYTSVYPFAKVMEEETERLLVLPERIIDSPHVGKYAKRKIFRLDLSNNDKIKTEEQLRKAAQSYIKSNQVGVPKTKLSIQYQDLSKVNGIFENPVLEEIDLCDRVKVFYEDLGISNEDAKVTKIIWNVLLDENEEVGIGDSRTNFSDSLGLASAVDTAVKEGTAGVAEDIHRKAAEQIAVWNRRFEEERQKIEDSVKEGIEEAKAKAAENQLALAQDIEGKLSEQREVAEREQADFVRRLEETSRDLGGVRQNVQVLSGQLNQALSAGEQARTEADQARTKADETASQLLEQARNQTDLVARVEQVEQLENGSRTSLIQLEKRVDGATGQLAGLVQSQRTTEERLNGMSSQYSELRANVDATSGKMRDYEQRTARFEQDLNGTKEKLERIRVGGRNYVFNSDTYITSGSKYLKINPDFFQHARGKEVILSVEVSGENVVAQGTGRYGVSFSYKPNDETPTRWWEAWQTGSENVVPKRIYTKFTFDESWTRTVDSLGLYIQTGQGARVGRPMLEIASTPSDWRQAPEDTDGLITAFTQTTADYQRTLEQNSTLLTQTRDKLGGFERQSASWIQKANGFEQAMNTLNEYTAENGRLKTDLKSYVRTETAERVRAERQALSDGFVAKAALTETVEGLHRKFEALYFGNNLYIIKNAQAGYLLSDSMSLGAQHATQKEFTSDFIRVFPAEVYTFQVWVTVPPNELAWRAYQFYDANKKLLGSRQVEGYERVSGFQHVKHLIRVPAGAAYLRVSARLYSDGKVKVEHSSSFNEWSLAPEDSESMVTNLTSKMADYKQTLDGLSSSLSRVESKIPSDGKIAQIVSSQTSTLSQTVNALSASVSSLNNNVVRRSELNLDNNGFVTKVGKTVDGRTLATMIAQNERDVRIIAEKMKVTGDMLVDGAVTARALDVSSVRAGILTANSITSHMLEADAVTADKLKVDSALIQKLAADDALIRSLTAKQAFITAVQAVDLSASRIKGGILQATNGAMHIGLNNGNITFNQNAVIEFNSPNNAIVRRKGTHTGFVHIADESKGGVYASIGVTSSGDGINSSSSGRFAGIRCFRTAEGWQHDALLDKIEIYGDTILFTDDFKINRGFKMRTDILPAGKTIDFNRWASVTQSLVNMWTHYKNMGGPWSDSSSDLRRDYANIKAGF